MGGGTGTDGNVPLSKPPYKVAYFPVEPFGSPDGLPSEHPAVELTTIDYDADLDVLEQEKEVLDTLFEVCNLWEEAPSLGDSTLLTYEKHYDSRSMSVGDMAAVENISTGKHSIYRCRSIGWTKIT